MRRPKEKVGRSIRGRPPREPKGLTLIEILVATVILAVAALIAFPTMLSFFDLSATAREENIATHDLHSAMEDLLATPFNNVTTTYEDGQAIPKFTDLHLPNQQITVSYPDPAADPLPINVTATWTDRKGRPRSENFWMLRSP